MLKSMEADRRQSLLLAEQLQRLLHRAQHFDLGVQLQPKQIESISDVLMTVNRHIIALDVMIAEELNRETGS